MALRFATAAREAYRFPLTIGHLLDTSLATAADQEIVYREKVRLSYRQLRERIGRLASALTAVGAEEGMTIAMLDWDSHRYLEAYFAIPMMGAVLQTVNVRLAPAQVAYTLRHARAEILVVHRDFFPLLESLLPSLPHVRVVLAMLDGCKEPLPSYALGEYEALLAAAKPDFPFRDFDENALATTFYTTGTTGDPKGVCFSHRQIVLLALAANAPFGVIRGRGLGYGDVYMPLTPMFHVHAWGVPYIATLLGLKQVYPGRFDPHRILDLYAQEGVTFSHCVPTILQMILGAAERRAMELTGWMMKIGGAALTPALWREGRKRGLDLVAGYGMSETAPTICIARSRAGGQNKDDEAETLTRAGVPIPLVSAQIVDEQLNPLPADGRTCGELVLRAPWLTQGYTEDPAASDSLWRGGWLHTQDVATIDPDGTITIRDRLKDVVKSGGEWLSSLTLERLIANVAGVGEAAVIGVPDAQWGERPIAVITVTGQLVPTLETINDPLKAASERGEISRYARLHRVEIIDSMPKTSVGKIDKKALRARFA